MNPGLRLDLSTDNKTIDQKSTGGSEGRIGTSLTSAVSQVSELRRVHPLAVKGAELLRLVGGDVVCPRAAAHLVAAGDLHLDQVSDSGDHVGDVLEGKSAVSFSPPSHSLSAASAL